MKNVLTLFAAAVLTLGLTGCKGEETKENSQMEAVIAVHDELMPKMTDIGLLREKLEDAVVDSTATQAQRQAILDLKEANAAMMTWMKDFGADFNFEEITQGKPLSKEKKKLLDSYETSVKDLKQQMQDAIENGQAVFDSLKQ